LGWVFFGQFNFKSLVASSVGDLDMGLFVLPFLRVTRRFKGDESVEEEATPGPAQLSLLSEVVRC
jgi:hypothetical protein